MAADGPKLIEWRLHWGQVLLRASLSARSMSSTASGGAPSTPRLVSAARVGPVVYGLLLTFRGDGYG